LEGKAGESVFVSFSPSSLKRQMKASDALEDGAVLLELLGSKNERNIFNVTVE
jgi:hypothetical protein